MACDAAQRVACSAPVRAALERQSIVRGSAAVSRTASNSSPSASAARRSLNLRAARRAGRFSTLTAAPVPASPSASRSSSVLGSTADAPRTRGHHVIRSGSGAATAVRTSRMAAAGARAGQDSAACNRAGRAARHRECRLPARGFERRRDPVQRAWPARGRAIGRAPDLLRQQQRRCARIEAADACQRRARLLLLRAANEGLGLSAARSHPAVITVVQARARRAGGRAGRRCARHAGRRLCVGRCCGRGRLR